MSIGRLSTRHAEYKRKRSLVMITSRPRDMTAAERLASTVRKAALAHERALLVELWAAEYFQCRGDMQAAQRHRDACGREAMYVESCYRRLSEIRQASG